MSEKFKSPEIIVYGGAFDPPHQGHVDSVTAACSVFPEARILIVPGRYPATINKGYKRSTLSFEQRMNLCKVAFSEVETGLKTTVSAIEASLPSPNYTLNTIKELRKNYRDQQFALLIGQDQFSVFDKWFKSLEILKLTNLIVISRRNCPKTNDGEVSLKETADRLSVRSNISLTWDNKGKIGMCSELNSWIYLLNANISDAASSTIQQLLATGESVPSMWLPKHVREYIASNGYYSEGKGDV